MNKALGITGWIVAVVALIGFGVFAFYSQRLSEEVELVRAESQAVESKLTDVYEQLDLVRRRDVSDAKDVNALEISLVAAQEEIMQLQAASQGAQLAAPAVPRTDDVEEPSKPKTWFDTYMEKMGDNDEMMATQVEMTVNMQYGPLFVDLELSGEVLRQMKDILKKATHKELKILSTMSGEDGLSGREWNVTKENATDRLREELSMILTEDELTTWEDFEANKMQHVVEQLYDMQLGIFAVGLTPGNKTMVRDIMVDERMRLQEAAFSDDPFAITEGWKAIFKNTRERIYPLLDNDQYAIVEAFLEQQEAITRMGVEKMGMEADEPEDDPDE